jgi:hypothetical protein
MSGFFRLLSSVLCLLSKLVTTSGTMLGRLTQP